MATPIDTVRVYNKPLPLGPSSLGCDEDVESASAPVPHQGHLQDVLDCVVGPMPVERFIRSCFRSSPSGPSKLSSRHAFKAVPKQANAASNIYKPLIAALNKQTRFKSRCPGFVFEDTFTRTPHPRKLGYLKPHICCFKTGHLNTIRSSSYDSRAELGYAELFIEVKGDPSHDFFVDPPQGASQAQREGHRFCTLGNYNEKDELQELLRKHLGQHISYVTEIFARQHRTFLYTISVSGTRVRLFRWDRAGCLVSESFDLHEQPDFLCDFLWLFSQASDGGRGHDLTISAASPGEEALFHSTIRDYVREQTELDGTELDQAVSEHYQPGHVSVVYVARAEDGTVNATNTRRYLVSRPVVAPSRLIGKGTTGYWAVDPLASRVVFLKDIWYLCAPGLCFEGAMLAHLGEHGVRNVPALEWHGVVPTFIPEGERACSSKDVQATRTDECYKRPWVCKVDEAAPPLMKHLHYRLVCSTVGYGLQRFRGTEELLYSTYDAFQAMRDAHTKAGILHRDISLGNIILVKEPGRNTRKGYLIDWEASCPVDELGRAVRDGLVGTWPFMAWDLISPVSPEDLKATFQHDMESLFYVVLYCALLWLPHNLSEGQLTIIMNHMFGSFSSDQDEWRGGHGKAVNALSRTYTRDLDLGSALGEWVNTVMDYHHPPRDSSMLTEYGLSRWSNPDYLDTFWAGFLQSHSLARNDRVVHNHPSATGGLVPVNGLYGCSSLSTLGKFTTPHTAPSKREAPELPDGRAPKRRKIHSPNLLSSGPIPCPERQQVPLRRSQRLQDKQVASEAAGPSSAPRVVKDSRVAQGRPLRQHKGRGGAGAPRSGRRSTAGGKVSR
ncbi:hypothetical protein GY45DRAFT_1243997 [Cubamyces sp. BRFM 1775]|nr:hypothetical protein GY45DRAFT_1243997 [Cubamyces sp. BRFM 1775]